MLSVLQPWVQNLTLMQQSVLLGAIRGPDGIQKYSAAKYLLRWFRRCVLISAFDNCVLTDPCDPRGGSFTGPSTSAANTAETTECFGTPVLSWILEMENHVGNYFREFDVYPSHFTKHFMMAVEILGYKHPDAAIRFWWNDLYMRLVKDLHLNPETEEQLDYRLGDKREQWASGAEPATQL